jgi:hypothetical protein
LENKQIYRAAVRTAIRLTEVSSSLTGSMPVLYTKSFLQQLPSASFPDGTDNNFQQQEILSPCSLCATGTGAMINVNAKKKGGMVSINY